jgi:hypothetical protein
MKIDNSCLERVEELKYLETNLTNQNSLRKEIKSRLKSGKACYHSAESLSRRLLSKNKYSKVYRTIILYYVVLYGCENSSLTQREECGLRVFDNRVLRGIFGPKRGEVRGEWKQLHNEELNDLYWSSNIFWAIK